MFAAVLAKPDMTSRKIFHMILKQNNCVTYIYFVAISSIKNFIHNT